MLPLNHWLQGSVHERVQTSIQHSWRNRQRRQDWSLSVKTMLKNKRPDCYWWILVPSECCQRIHPAWPMTGKIAALSKKKLLACFKHFETKCLYIKNLFLFSFIVDSHFLVLTLFTVWTIGSSYFFYLTFRHLRLIITHKPELHVIPDPAWH